MLNSDHVIARVCTVCVGRVCTLLYKCVCVTECLYPPVMYIYYSRSYEATSDSRMSNLRGQVDEV